MPDIPCNFAVRRVCDKFIGVEKRQLSEYGHRFERISWSGFLGRGLARISGSRGTEIAKSAVTRNEIESTVKHLQLSNPGCAGDGETEKFEETSWSRSWR
jgi:hypothetical protein